MGYREVLELPAKTFWMLHKNIDRISAEEDIRDLQVAAHSHSGESIKEMLESLQAQMGDVIKVETRIVMGKPVMNIKLLNAIGDTSNNAYPG